LKASSHFDVIVIGVGSMGSSACYFLAKQGVRVLGLEQFGIVHDQGSHAGQSRIIRKAYFEHPDYVPLLERAYQNWRALEEETKSEIYYRTGIVYFGRPDHDTMTGIKRSASLYKVPVETLTGSQSQEKFPMFRIPSDFETLVEPDAGFVTPERAIRLYAKKAIAMGATIRAHEKVMSWKQEGEVINVLTDQGTYTADKLIITAGSWTSKVIPDLRPTLKITRQMLAWVQPKHQHLFSLENFPCWFIEDPELGMFYGFPILAKEKFDGPQGLKLAHHRPGSVSDPDRVDRVSSAEEKENISYILSKYIPEANGYIRETKTCLYTYTADENFIIDHLPDHNKRVAIACGFSGHGFKFVSVVGEILADLSMKGKTDLPIEFLSLSRFV
jgi:sarcosine oxidase